MTPDRTPPIGLRDPALRDEFRRALVRWSLAFWALAYVFLTLRSLTVRTVTSSHDPLDAFALQALLRVPMIAIGLGICAGLFLLLIRLERRPLAAKVALISPAVILGTLLFSTSAYLVFYAWPHGWEQDRTLVEYLAGYMVQFCWIFGAWALLFYYVRHRVLTAAAAAAAREFTAELWARQRGRQVRIPVGDIEWIEAEGDYARVHVGETSFLIRSTMQRLEDSLDPDVLMRVHRRAIVARDAIVAASRGRDGRLTVQLRSGVTIPVGRRYAERLRPHVRPADAAARAE